MTVSETILKTRLGAKAQVVLPKPVRDLLGLKPGDEFAFLIEDGEVRVVRAPAEAEDPFATFTEWASEADRKGYADL
jgi:antitoxin PrlF